MKKILTLVMSLVLVLGLVAPAMAADDFKYTPVAGTYTTFDKYLVLDDEAAVPDLVFEYTVTGVAKAAATAGSTFEVIGTNEEPHNTMPTMYQVESVAAAETATAPAAAAQKKLTFVQNEAKTTTKGTEWLELDTGKAFVKRIMKVDFTGVNFDEPGIYRYEIEEKEITGRTDISYDTQASTPGAMKRYLDVYVTENGNKQLVVSGYVFHENKSTINATPEYGSVNEKATGWSYDGTDYTDKTEAENAAVAQVTVNAQDDTKFDYKGTTYNTRAEAETAAKKDVKVTAVELDDKSSGYVNELATYDLEFGKEVEGNQGSKDKYFKFTVKIENLVEGTVLQLDVASKADTTPRTNSATKAEYTEAVMAEANGVDQQTDTATLTGQQLVVAAGATSIEVPFYLQDGQYIAIKGLPVGATYTITEDEEDYKKTNGTEIATKQVLETVGDALDNKHQDATTGTIGGKEKYVVDNTNGTFWKDGSTFKEIIVVDNVKYVAYTDTTNNTPYDADDHGDLYKLNDQNVYTGYTNTKQGVIPTGIMMSIAGGAALVAIAGAGILVLNRKKREED